MRERTLIRSTVIAVVLAAAAYVALRREPLRNDAVDVPWAKPQVERDLGAIAQDTLRVLVICDPLTWEERPKAVSGLEHDLMLRFAKVAGLPVVLVPFTHPDSMLLALQQGRGDLIAAQWSPRKAQKKWVSFSEPYRMVRPVLAMLRPDPLAKGKMDAATITVRVDTAELSPWSPFSDPGYAFTHEGVKTRIHIDPKSTPEEVLMDVVTGKHMATIITDARAAYEAGRFPVLEFSGPIGPERPLCFVVRKNAPALLARLNAWLKDPEELAAREQFVKGYASTIPRPGPLRTRKGIPVNGDSISPYDADFQRYADRSGWDWELLAAMAYKESRFDSTAVSSKGAQGIMQLMPNTALRLGVDPDANDMGDHIRAAALYLNKLDTMWMRAVPDKEQRLRFMLASYNAGPGHIIDAQRLAEHLGLDPKRWEHNVERAVLLLAKPRYYMEPSMKNGYCKGSQVFHYVRDVSAMYRQLKAHRVNTEVASTEVVEQPAASP